jgi:hypothetical protein
VRARAAALALLALAAGGCVPAESFFFAPERVDDHDLDHVEGDLGEPHPSIIAPADRREGFVETPHGAVHWVFARHPEATDVILYSHGTAVHLGRYWDRVERLWNLGFHVLIYDYPGYGRSEGEPGEAAVLASARAVRERLEGFDEIEGARVFLYGYSLGGAPSFDLAAAAERGEAPPVDGVIGEAVWCSVEDLFQDAAQVGLPGHYLTDLEMDNCARLAELRDTPVLLMHGTEDAVIPPRHLDLLLEAAPEALPVEARRVEGATHEDLPLVAEGYDAWIEAFAP